MKRIVIAWLLCVCLAFSACAGPGSGGENSLPEDTESSDAFGEATSEQESSTDEDPQQAEQPDDTAQTAEAAQSGTAEHAVFLDLYTDKSRYDVGEPVTAFIELLPVETDTVLHVSVQHLTDEVFSADVTVTANGENSVQDLEICMPEQDFTGYSLQVTALQGDETVDREMTAIEVASDWSVFPRYAYLTRYRRQTEEDIEETIGRLSKHHITGLFYYDVLDRHEDPAAGTSEEPAEDWYTLADSHAYRSVVTGLIDAGHARGMNSYLYDLIFGAYQDYEQSGILPEWGLYRDADHEVQDYHGELPGSWETQRIYLFDPSNEAWRAYYISAMQEALTLYPYDGLQLDSLGDRGRLYTYEGKKVELNETYAPFINSLVDALDTRVIFNPVSGYGMEECLEEVDYDIVYEEVWPWDVPFYDSLAQEIDRLRVQTADDKGIVLAAYMDYDKGSGEFNLPGILLTDAVMMASGAAHLEIGDTGMLKSEYYPGETLQIGENLEAALRNYYSFFTAYENILREADLQKTDGETYIDGEAAFSNIAPDRIWTVSKSDGQQEVVNFVNFTGISALGWVDASGDRPAPTAQKDLEVRHYTDIVPEQVCFASPDLDEGIMTELEFTCGEDDAGKYVSFRLPELHYWDTVLIR